jgi:aryl-alcohol dehydrogenase-like predicted oxidoreductase
MAGLTDFLTLGRSGLGVSPLCLGAMTFGPAPGMGVDAGMSTDILRAYVETGGNFIDTADVYGGGESERIIGRWLQEDSTRRDSIVLASKFTLGGAAKHPNGSGNGRKHAYRSLEGSLQRLGTDYLDLYWMHAWDSVTPVEEVVETFDLLIRSGRVRYWGLSDVPAWYAARAVSVAERYGMARPIALQLSYSLADRAVEREHLPAARELGLGFCPFGPLSGGALTGKYRPDGSGEGRLTKAGFAAYRLRNPKLWPVLEVLEAVAREVARTPVEVAVQWAGSQYPSTSVLVGATSVAQLRGNLSALDVVLSEEQKQRLDEVSALEIVSPYHFFRAGTRAQLMGGAPRGWR